MGRRGPPAKPTAQKKAEGNPGHRKLPENEPQPRMAHSPPAPPRHLPEMAQTAWKLLAKELHSVGLLTVVDYHVLEQYCVAYAFWRMHLVSLKKAANHIIRVYDNAGNLKYEAPSATSILLTKYAAELNRCSKVLGLGPAYRVPLNGTGPGGDHMPEDPLAAALRGGDAEG